MSRLIHVPPAPTPLPIYDPMRSSGAPVAMTMITDAGDPLIPIFNFYRMKSSARATKTIPEQHIARFDAYDFEWRFWGGEDVEDWISANCNRPVLLQPVLHRLHFCFIEPDKTMRFVAWVLSHPQKKWIDVKDQNQNEVWNWCRDNLKGEVDFYPTQSLIRVAFKEEKDEVLFKLRWMGASQ